MIDPGNGASGLTATRRPWRGANIVVLVVALAGLLLPAGATPASAANGGTYPVTCVSRPAPITPHAPLTDVSLVGRGRLHTYTVTSPLVGVTHVNVLLPVDYGHDSRRYPVLYLLHGALGSYADWASTRVAGGAPQGGNVEAIVGTLPVIVVMPDDSGNGSYSDWYGISTADGALRPVPRAPAWESFHIDELIPWVDATFATRADHADRIIAGLSSGGAGAAEYAAAHPGLFAFAGMFSGALDTDLVDATTNSYSQSGIFHSANPPDDRCVFGNPFPTAAGNAAYYWHDNDPTYLAANLSGTRLFVTSGNGTPSAADAATNPAISAVQGAIETVVDDMSHHFVTALHAAGLAGNLTTDFYGRGVHSWYYWQRDLAAFLRWLRPQLGHPAAAPASFSYRTARTASSAWGWAFAFDSGRTVRNLNTATSFVYLDHVSANGFTAAGNGTLGVITPAHSYQPRSAHEVTIGPKTTHVEANDNGQLKLDVVIGPPAKQVQRVFPASGPPPGLPHVTVTIAPARRTNSPTPPRSHGSSRSGLVAGAAVLFPAALLAIGLIWRRRRRRNDSG